jgi:FtsH-binding integral membrane protein
VIEDPENPQLPPESHSTHKFTYYIYGTLSATLGVLSLAFSLISLRSFNKHQAGTAVAPFYACLVFSIITVVYVIYNTSALSDILSSISEI